MEKYGGDSSERKLGAKWQFWNDKKLNYGL